MKRIVRLFIAAGLILTSACDKNKNEDQEPDGYEPLFDIPEVLNKNNTAGQGYAIGVSTSDDISWSATVPPSCTWITLVSSSGRGNGQVVFDLEANNGFDERRADVTFTASSDKAGAVNFTRICTVHQIGKSPAIVILPSETAEIPSDPVSEYTITVVSNVEWRVLTEISPGDVPGWISVIEPVDASNGDGQVKLAILENLLRTPRNGKITVISTADPVLKQELTIVQAGKVYTLSVDPEETIPVSSQAWPDVSIAVTSNDTWTVSVIVNQDDEANWVSIVSPSNEVTGNGNITLAILENGSGSLRTATLTVASTQFDDLTRTLTITQQPAGITYSIDIPGMTAVLATGTAIMTVTGLSGVPANLPVTVSDDGARTTIEFTQILAAGNYTVNSLQYGSNPPVPLNAKITVDAAGTVIYVEHWDVTFECFGGDSEDRPVYINNVADLDKLRTAVNNGISFAGLYLKQTDNLDISSYSNWIPIGNSETTAFAGVYQGGNFKISGIKISADNAALFGYIGGTVSYPAGIRDLTIEGANSGSDDITGVTSGTIAGIAAFVSTYTTIDNCTNKANLSGGITAASSIGGIVAVISDVEVIISNCKNQGSVTSMLGSTGGIAGKIERTGVTLSKCINTGTISSGTISVGGGATGGIAGILGSAASVNISMCSNKGVISQSFNSTKGTGGIVGQLHGTSTVTQCYNIAEIISFTNTGGIAGLCSSASANVNNCYNTGNITYTETAVNNGGITGNLTNALTLSVSSCYNSGEAIARGTGAKRYGGIASANKGDATTFSSNITLCYYETSKGFSGGLGGNLTPVDIEGKAEGKNDTWFKSGTPITGWDTSIWQFTPGAYPSLTNNPE